MQHADWVNASVIESRLDDSCLAREYLIAQNEYNLARCIAYKCEYILINTFYDKLITI